MSVQPTREQIAALIEHVRAAHEALTSADRGTWVRELQTTLHDLSRAKVFEAQRELSAAVALFPQPTPSLPLDVAEQTAITRSIDEEFTQEGGTTRHWVQALNRAGYVIAPAAQPPMAEPVSIADMAPGLRAAVERAQLVADGFVQHNWASSTPVHEWYRDEIRKLVATIRDITPPPTTPEENR